MKTLATLAMTASMNLSSQGGDSPTAQTSSFHHVRPFCLSDQAALERICENVYGGRDYLPHTSSALLNDPLSEFLVLQDADSNEVTAVANARRLELDDIVWLEAVRTSHKHRGQGLATTLTQHIMELALLNNQRLYSCTVQSNEAMLKVFRRVGLQPRGSIHQLSFSELLKLEGWSADDSRPARPLLQALGMYETVSEMGKDCTTWIRVESMAELQQVLLQIQYNGGSGYLPGLYELLSKRQLAKAFESRKIWKNQRETAVMALIEDEKIQSLRSPWVCSIAAANADNVEAALWYACQATNAVPFTVAVNGAVSLRESSVLRALPFVDDPCLLFGTE